MKVNNINESYNTITHATYNTMLYLIKLLEEEVNYKYYRHGKGKHCTSPAKILRRYGFSINSKKRLLGTVKEYLSKVEVL